RQPLHAGHRRHRCATGGLVHEHRVDQVAGGEYGFAHQPAREIVAPHPPHAGIGKGHGGILLAAPSGRDWPRGRGRSREPTRDGLDNARHPRFRGDDEQERNDVAPQAMPPKSPRRQIATMMTMPLSTKPVLARPRLPARVNSTPIAARIAPTAANGISNQLVMPTMGSRARIIQASATMPQSRLINPMVSFSGGGGRAAR